MSSIWTQDCKIRPREPLPHNMETQVAVIGAGMAGVLIAHKLQEAGRQVLVLEADRIGSGQTRNTTAKISSQHGLIYSRLIKSLGPDKARQYAAANQEAVEEYKKLIRERNIDCELAEESSFVYGGDVETLREEAEAARALGLPASFQSSVPIPGGGTAAAVRFDGQAQFNPLKFLRAVSDNLTIYENSSVQEIRDNFLHTERGSVRAEQIVFATHYPFVNFPGLFFARMHQERSYVLALKNAPSPQGMYIGAQEPIYSFRRYGDLLIFGGEAHRTGENSEGGCYEALLQKAAEWFPVSREVARWSAQDCIPADGVPYIGRISDGQAAYVATGFQKWGMSSSMVAATLLRDLICCGSSPYAEVFDPRRLSAASVAGIAKEGAQAAKSLLRRIFQIPAEAAADLPPDHGGVVFHEGKKVGVYRDIHGDIHAVDLTCPHLGCQLEWNPDERSWDCPCHGSRFNYQGHLISGPAQENITK